MKTRGTPAVQGALAYAVAVLLLWATRGVPAGVSALAPDVWAASPWFVADQALRLYVLLPVAVLAAAVVWIAPGLWLVAAFSRPASTAEWVLRGFLVALGVQTAGTMALALLVSGHVPADAQFGTGIGCGVAAALVHALRRRPRAGPPADPPTWTLDPIRVGFMVALAWGLIVGLLPELFWEDLSGDGMEVLELGRSLAWFPVARGLGGVHLGTAAGMFTVGFPIRWLQGAWGPIAATARLPLALYAPVLFSAVLVLVEHAAPRRLRRLEALALAGGVAMVAVGMALNASYNPYMADPASPTALSMLTVTLLLGAAASLLQRRTGWFVAFFVMGLLTRPTMLPFSVFVALGAAVVDARRRRWYLGHAALAVAVALAFGWLTGLAYRWTGTEVVYANTTLLQRFRYLDLLPLDRLRLVLAPIGLLPGLALLAWRRQDAVARTLTITAALYFALVGFPAFVALHHFTPVMVLPLVIFWRCALAVERIDRRWTAAGWAAAAIALVLVLPPNPGPTTVFRSLGERTAITVGDYGSESWDEHVASLHIQEAVGLLLQTDRRTGDPDTELVAQGQLPFYAGADPDAADFVFHPAGSPPGPEWIPLGEAAGVGVAVRSLEDWRRMRGDVPSTDFRSRWLTIPDETLFDFIGASEGAFDLDLSSLPGLWRLFQ